MRTFTLAALVLSLCSPAALLAQNQGQPKAPDQPAPGKDKKDAKPAGQAPAPDAEMEAWLKTASPGPMHKWMEQFVGEWQTTSTTFMPDGTAMPSEHGTMTYTMSHGGRFINMDMRSRFMGQPYRGSGTMGYNNIDKRFESTWVDTMSSSIIFMTGQADKEGKVLTLAGEFTNPDGSKSMMKEVTTVLSKESHKNEFYDVKDGKPVKIMEVTYAKGSKADKKPGKDKEKDKDHDKPKDAPGK
jgi:hypothetical protein